MRSPSSVVGAGWVRNNNSSFLKSGIAGTLLGPEATPGSVWVCRSILVVGCGV